MASGNPHSIVEQALSRTTGEAVRILRSTALGGGDISEVCRLETSGGPFVLKSHPHPPDGFFQAEAAGLTAIRGSRTTLRTPAAIAVDRTFLLLEDLGSGRPVAQFDEALGRGLAEMHRATAPAFGFARDTFCGTTRQPNAWMPRWIDFYGQARLGYQADLALQTGRLSNAERDEVARLIARLDRLIDEPADAPSLVHGDLWSGNVHTTAAGTPAIIDPSAYFGHRESEFGMMTLFGSFSSRVYDAYHEAYPLAPGWRERNPLYQLYHLLNHLNLFGGGYHAQAMGIVRRYS